MMPASLKTVSRRMIGWRNSSADASYLNRVVLFGSPASFMALSQKVRNVRRTKSVGIGIHAVPVGPIERAIFQFDLEPAVSAVI